MRPAFQRLMQVAARLTRSGQLSEATAVIQSALAPAPAAPGPVSRPAAPDGIVLDVEARPIVPAPPADDPTEGVGDASCLRTPTGAFIDGHSQGRAFRLYIPPQAGERPLPLIVMLHGCTQDPDDFAAGTRMNEAAQLQGCFVLYPAQSRSANPQGCWNWFKHSHQARGRGEPALLAAMTREIMSQHSVDPARIYVAGLSAGGAMAAILGDAYPDLFAAVGVHSGLATGSAKDLPSALAAMRQGAPAARASASRRPTIVFHGDADTTVHPENGEHVLSASAGPVPPAEADTQRGSNYTRTLHRDAQGRVMAEHWCVHGVGHAWSGGSKHGSYTDPQGPDATHEMLRFFLEHRLQ
jgi:poly(hydroxyalkanoate) depolymerase family esterase